MDWAVDNHNRNEKNNQALVQKDEQIAKLRQGVDVQKYELTLAERDALRLQAQNERAKIDRLEEKVREYEELQRSRTFKLAMKFRRISTACLLYTSETEAKRRGKPLWSNDTGREQTYQTVPAGRHVECRQFD